MTAAARLRPLAGKATNSASGGVGDEAIAACSLRRFGDVDEHDVDRRGLERLLRAAPSLRSPRRHDPPVAAPCAAADREWRPWRRSTAARRSAPCRGAPRHRRAGTSRRARPSGTCRRRPAPTGYNAETPRTRTTTSNARSRHGASCKCSEYSTGSDRTDLEKSLRFFSALGARRNGQSRCPPRHAEAEVPRSGRCPTGRGQSRSESPRSRQPAEARGSAAGACGIVPRLALITRSAPVSTSSDHEHEVMLVVGRAQAVDAPAVLRPRRRRASPGRSGRATRCRPPRPPSGRRRSRTGSTCHRATTAGAPRTAGSRLTSITGSARPPTRAFTSARLARISARDVGDPFAIGRPRRRVLVVSSRRQRARVCRPQIEVIQRRDPPTRIPSAGSRRAGTPDACPSGENASDPTASDAAPSKSALGDQRLLQVALLVLQPDLQVAGAVGDERELRVDRRGGRVVLVACAAEERPERANRRAALRRDRSPWPPSRTPACVRRATGSVSSRCRRVVVSGVTSVGARVRQPEMRARRRAIGSRRRRGDGCPAAS